MTMTDHEHGDPSGPEARRTTTAYFPDVYPSSHPSFSSDGSGADEEPQTVFAEEFNAVRGVDLTLGYLALGDARSDEMLPEIERLIADAEGQIERGDLVLPSAMDVHQYVASVIVGAIPEGEREALALAFEDRRQMANGFEVHQQEEELLAARRRIVELEAQTRQGKILTAIANAKLEQVVDLIDSPVVKAKAQKVVASPVVSAQYFREPVLEEEMTDTERLVVYGRWNEVMEMARRAVKGTTSLLKGDFRKVS
ncbi:MAG: hypothetical protein WAO28_00150 [Candidatus Microsaccharimonas sp.]